MKETGIIMSGDHPRLVLDGIKTQTRRVIKPQPPDKFPFPFLSGSRVLWSEEKAGDYPMWTNFSLCPYGQVGDRLWVRETWAVDKKWDNFKPRDIPEGESVYYPYGGDPEDDVPCPYWVGKIRPSMFMPRWASRITLEITEVRVERVQEIIGEDAFAEGLRNKVYSNFEPDFDIAIYSAREAFHSLWDSLNEKRGYGWEANPFCWVISFRKEV